MRRTAFLATTLALLVPAAAIAKVPSGQWTGHYGTNSSSKVSFKVKNNAIHDFSSFVPAYCETSATFTFDTFHVPKAAIHKGKAKTTYHVKNDHGETIGTLHLKATFKGSHATGQLSGSYAGCTIAKYSWTAQH